MTTSKRISVLFAGYVSILILVFGIVINMIFFLSWYRIIDAGPMMKTSDLGSRFGSGELSGMKHIGPPPQFQDVQFFDRFARPMLRGQQSLVVTNEEFIQSLKKRKDRFDLISYENQIYHYHIDEKRGVLLTSVDSLVDSQLLLIYITIACAVVFAGLSYLVSLRVVRRGLKPLHQLTKHIQQVKDPEHYEHIQVGPDYDELEQVSSAFTHAMDVIADQSKRLKQFITHASHELKTPLMVISSATDVLRKQGYDSEQLTAIKNTTTRMKHLIDRLMTTMRYDSVHKESLDIIPLLCKWFDQHYDIADERGMNLDVVMPSALILSTDTTMLESIITNLLMNAYKYAIPCTTIHIEVNDTSCMISNSLDPHHIPADIDTIWQPFYRVDESRTDDTSYGLGLTIVHQLVERLGWNTAVEIQGDCIVFTIKWSE